MSREAREWKKAFDSNYDVENPPEVPRVDLTVKQKNWLVRAWTFFFGGVPNGIPVYNEREGFAHRPANQTHWHHIEPIGESTRLHGDYNYNHPRNFAPVDARNHVGRGADDDDFVIHTDTKEATGLWGLFKKKEIQENPYTTMDRNRREATTRGEKYHETDYDSYLTDTAREVVDKYTQENPEDVWPG